MSATPYLRQQWVEADRPGFLIEATGTQAVPHAARAGHPQRAHLRRFNFGHGGENNGQRRLLGPNRPNPEFDGAAELGEHLGPNHLPDVDDLLWEGLRDGRGIAPPDVDNNCHIEVIIYDIDGQYNIGGYFAPSFASQGEMVFVDYADVTLTWGRSIIAHEPQHLLHNALDPYENLYIDEGNADVAIYLCFGADSTLTGHVNGWTQNSALSVR